MPNSQKAFIQGLWQEINIQFCTAMCLGFQAQQVMHIKICNTCCNNKAEAKGK